MIDARNRHVVDEAMEEQRRDAVLPGFVTHRRLPRELRPTVAFLLGEGFVRLDDREGRRETIVVFSKGAGTCRVSLARPGEDEGIRSPWTWVLEIGRYTYAKIEGRGVRALKRALKGR